MNVIKTLEMIGQNTSKKHYQSTQQMLNSLEISDNLNSIIQENSMEFICAIKPEDDDDKK